ncbi:hypothetical protein VTL71DRAFT_13243 [Oculimacula yallundae]|uniref:Tachykinin family protein n=1 Tax=Oculimacula yallundae TaxID=86028 RepID=A0ABR4CL28_9HELO
MSTKLGPTANDEPAAEATAAQATADVSLLNRQRIKYTPALRRKHVTLRPAPAAPTRSRESEKEIRKRLMQDLPKARRLIIRNRIELTLPADFNNPSNKSLATTHTQSLDRDYVGLNAVIDISLVRTTGSEQATNFAVAEAGRQALPSPQTILGAGRVDPFGNYPIPISINERWLLDQVNTSDRLIFKTFRNSWLPTALQDPATFHQFLANVSLNLYQIQGQTRNKTMAVHHHAIALRTVNGVLSDPARNTSDGIIASVVTFVCYCVTQDDLAGFDVHIDGLVNIIRLRGGLETLDYCLRLMVFGVDLAGACRRDSRPKFPAPHHLIQAIQGEFRSKLIGKLSPNHVTSRSLRPWANAVSGNALLITALDNLLKAINYTKIQTARGENWIGLKLIVFWVDPIVHDLLGQGAEAQPTDKSVVHEAIRLGLILFLFKLRRICGQLAVSTTFFVTKLRRLTSTMAGKMMWRTSERMLTWVLFVGMLESWQTEDEEWYVETAAMAAHSQGLNSWDDIMDAVKNFPWIEGVFDAECGRCKEKFEVIMRDSVQEDYALDTSDKHRQI